MFVATRKYLEKIMGHEALNVLVADDFDIFSGKSGRLSYDDGSVIFVVGLTVTGAGGATGVIADIIGDATSGILVLNDCTGTFNDNEVITDTGTGAAVVDGTFGPHTGNWVGFTVAQATEFAAITTGEGVKQNVANTFGVAFKCIADIVAMQLTSGVIMAHKINES